MQEKKKQLTTEFELWNIKSDMFLLHFCIWYSLNKHKKTDKTNLLLS